MKVNSRITTSFDSRIIVRVFFSLSQRDLYLKCLTYSIQNLEIGFQIEFKCSPSKKENNKRKFLVHCHLFKCSDLKANSKIKKLF